MNNNPAVANWGTDGELHGLNTWMAPGICGLFAVIHGDYNSE